MEIFNYDNRSLRLLNILESNFLVQDKYLIDVLKDSSKTINNEIKSLNLVHILKVKIQIIVFI